MARVTALGRSGTGKSYYAGYLLERVVPDFDLAVHFDIEDEEQGLSATNADADALYRTVRVERDVANELNWLRVVARYRKIRVVPESMTKDEMRVLYAELCRVVMRLCKDVKPSLTAFVSCDEAHTILKQSNFPSTVERLITGGRKHGVECLHISQRPQLLHTTIISQADKRIYFGTSDDNDLDKIDKSANFDAHSTLKRLPSRTCIVENKDTGEWVEEDTEGVDRRRPHYSGDDGIVDEALPV